MLQVDIVGVLERSASGEPSIVVTAPGREVGASTRGPIGEDLARRQASSPCQYPEDPGIWLYRGYVVKVTGTPADQDELALRIEHAVLRQRKALDRLRRELQAGTETPGDQETIPEDVRLLVWQRDGGRCVKCGSRRRLAFRRVIPAREGGGNAASNVQLICQRCVLGVDSAQHLARSLIIAVLVIAAAIVLVPVFIEVLVVLAWVFGLLGSFEGI